MTAASAFAAHQGPPKVSTKLPAVIEAAFKSAYPKGQTTLARFKGVFLIGSARTRMPVAA